jgi:hypothetical protein
MTVSVSLGFQIKGKDETKQFMIYVYSGHKGLLQSESEGHIISALGVG